MALADDGDDLVATPVSPQRSGSLPALQQQREAERQTTQKGLYEVTSGMVMMRQEPYVQATGLGVLRGGVRFIGTPHRIGNSTWILISSEGATPPVFSPKNPKASGKQVIMKPSAFKGQRLHAQSTPTALCPDAGLDLAGDVWVQHDAQCIHRLRDKARQRKKNGEQYAESDDGASEGGTPDSVRFARRQYELFGNQHGGIRSPSSLGSPSRRSAVAATGTMPSKDATAAVAAAAAVKASNPRLSHSTSTAETWASCSKGSWCNMRRYGVNHSPPNNNCGRWRQMNSVGPGVYPFPL